jgi:hypothetical protein
MFLPRVMFVAVALILSVLRQGAQAGIATYEFVDYPDFQTGGTTIYHIQGFINLNDSAIGGTDILESDVISYSLTISHGSTIDQTFTNTSSSLEFIHVAATSSAIFLPIQPDINVGVSRFAMGDGTSGFVEEESTNSPVDKKEIFFDSANSTSRWNNHIDIAFNPLFDPLNVAVREPTSVVPEPSSLVIAMTLFGGFGLMGVRRRRQRQQPA